jgi:amino acid permease
MEYNLEEISENYHKNIGNLANLENLPAFMGIALFSMECVGTILPVKNSMRKPENFNNVYKNVCILVGFIFVFFCTICSLCMGIY